MWDDQSAVFGCDQTSTSSPVLPGRMLGVVAFVPAVFYGDLVVPFDPLDFVQCSGVEVVDSGSGSEFGVVRDGWCPHSGF